MCDVLRSWPAAKLTWGHLVDAVETYLGHRWTRQALEKQDAIKSAFQERKDALRGGRRASTAPTDPAEVVLQRRVGDLTKQVEDLKRQIASYEDLFIRHHYNAHARGVTAAELAMPLPRIDRGQTDER